MVRNCPDCNSPPSQILYQLIGVGIAWALAIGLRASREDEMQGLDLSMHGEEGYILEP